MEYRESLMWKELNAAPELLKTLKEKNSAVLDKIAKAVQGAKITNIYTAARGTSDHAMIYFKYLAESLLGLPTASGAPSVFTMYGARMDLSHALTIGCSQSGKAADVMEVIKAGNESGGITVAITNDAESPLAKLAQYHLCCCAGEEKSVAATKTFSCQLFLAALLAEAMGGKAIADDIGEKLAAALPAIDKATDAPAQAFLGAEECFILSRGISSAIAFECGLKLQETCYIRARAYHSSDFYHGPMAMVGDKTKVILFAAKHSLRESMDEMHREDYIKCAQKMKELGADLYIVTDDAESFGGSGAKLLCVPTLGNEAEQIFAFALAAQMLACKVSCGKGLNPDSPRALKKVTVTR